MKNQTKQPVKNATAAATAENATIQRNSGSLRQAESFGSESHGLTCEDRLGMFEAGLEELAKCFHFDAANCEGGVRLTISGVERIDYADGTWSLKVGEPPAIGGRT